MHYNLAMKGNLKVSIKETVMRHHSLRNHWGIDTHCDTGNENKTNRNLSEDLEK